MATELTYDPSEVSDGEFTSEELESLQLGEQAQAAEQELLAGKFRDAQSLEQAYIELQRKLGERSKEQPAAEEETTEDTPPEEVEEDSPEEFTEAEKAITNASAEFYENGGEISKETFEQLSKLSSEELLNAYIKLQSNQQQAPATDLSDSQVEEIKRFGGGEQEYQNMVQWAQAAMPDNYVNAFDRVIQFGDIDMIKLAVAGMRSAYQEANGYEGRMLSGKAPVTKEDGFRSQAEVVRAMSDPRYDSDPAYRQDVFDRLERSSINY